MKIIRNISLEIIIIILTVVAFISLLFLYAKEEIEWDKWAIQNCEVKKEISGEYYWGTDIEGRIIQLYSPSKKEYHCSDGKIYTK